MMVLTLQSSKVKLAALWLSIAQNMRSATLLSGSFESQPYMKQFLLQECPWKSQNMTTGLSWRKVWRTRLEYLWE